MLVQCKPGALMPYMFTLMLWLCDARGPVCTLHTALTGGDHPPRTS